jgi:hypothetical protein
MSTPFDPDATQEFRPLRLPHSPTGVVALDADAPENAGVVDSYSASSVVLHIRITERGRVILEGTDWRDSLVTPGRYAVLIELDPV